MIPYEQLVAAIHNWRAGHRPPVSNARTNYGGDDASAYADASGEAEVVEEEPSGVMEVDDAGSYEAEVAVDGAGEAGGAGEAAYPAEGSAETDAYGDQRYG